MCLCMCLCLCFSMCSKSGCENVLCVCVCVCTRMRLCFSMCSKSGCENVFVHVYVRTCVCVSNMFCKTHGENVFAYVCMHVMEVSVYACYVSVCVCM
jgi:hypothetical protein